MTIIIYVLIGRVQNYQRKRLKGQDVKINIGEYGISNRSETEDTCMK